MSGFLKESSQEETLPFSLTEVGREDRKGWGSSKPLTTPYPRIPDLPRGARANATPKGVSVLTSPLSTLLQQHPFLLNLLEDHFYQKAK